MYYIKTFKQDVETRYRSKILNEDIKATSTNEILQQYSKTALQQYIETHWNNIVKQYIGLAGNTFKKRFNNHTKSLRLEKYKKETELSKYVWDLKDKGKDFEIKYNIVCQSNTTTRKSGICNLCLEEKFYILCVKQENKVNLLNKRSEMISKCRHGNRPSNQAKKK